MDDYDVVQYRNLKRDYADLEGRLTVTLAELYNAKRAMRPDQQEIFEVLQKQDKVSSAQTDLIVDMKGVLDKMASVMELFKDALFILNNPIRVYHSTNTEFPQKVVWDKDRFDRRESK